LFALDALQRLVLDHPVKPGTPNARRNRLRIGPTWGRLPIGHGQVVSLLQGALACPGERQIVGGCAGDAQLSSDCWRVGACDDDIVSASFAGILEITFSGAGYSNSVTEVRGTDSRTLPRKKRWASWTLYSGAKEGAR
jgi:hypothetical protein